MRVRDLMVLLSQISPEAEVMVSAGVERIETVGEVETIPTHAPKHDCDFVFIHYLGAKTVNDRANERRRKHSTEGS